MPSAIHIDGSKLESRSETQLDDFHRMIKDICQLVDAAPGNNFSDIDKMPIIQKMDDYKSDPREWAKYAYKDEKQCFTRNMVDRGNGKCNAVC